MVPKLLPLSDSQLRSRFQVLQSKRQASSKALLFQADLEICQQDFEYISQNKKLYNHWMNIRELVPRSPRELQNCQLCIKK